MYYSDLHLDKPTGIILAGGKSSRMGKEKANLKLGNKTFIEIILQTISPLCSDILISTNNRHLNFPGTESVPDLIKNIGPLGGIYTCLKYSDKFKNIVVTVDTPFISSNLLKYVLDQSENFDVTYCEHNNKEHPLIGVFTKNFLKVIENDIQKGKYKMLNSIYKSKSKKLLIKKDHPVYTDKLFLNINDPTDLQNLQLL